MHIKTLFAPTYLPPFVAGFPRILASVVAGSKNSPESRPTRIQYNIDTDAPHNSHMQNPDDKVRV